MIQSHQFQAIDLMAFDACYEPLLARRIPRSDIISGRAYVIHARNGGVGVAIVENGELGYRLHRVKFEHHFLFVELDWDQGPPYGTAIPLAIIDAAPPSDDVALLEWLGAMEIEHEDIIRKTWDEVLQRARGPA